MEPLELSGLSGFFPALDDGPTSFVQRFFGVSVCCPDCRRSFAQKVEARFLAGDRVKCHCGWRGKWRDRTPLHRSRLSDAQFVMLLAGLTWGVPSVRIANLLAVDPETVRDWQARLQLLSREAA